MSQIKTITIKLALIGLFIIFLPNCRSNSQKGSGDLPICDPQLKMRVPLSSPFDANKIQLEPQTLQKNSEIDLAFAVDTACIDALGQPLYILGHKVEVPESLKELPQAALALTVTGPIDQEQLTKDMYQSPCLLGITEDMPVELDIPEETKGGGTLIQKNLDDPKAGEQAHLGFLNHSSTLEIQNHIDEQVIVAVLDTGINEDHPELHRRMWESLLGRHGENFTNPNPRNGNSSDDDGQGTHIAGIIGAQQNNGYGVAGLLGGFVRLMSVKVLGGRHTQSKGSGVFNGIQYAVNRGADVINLSLGDDRVNVLTMAGVLTAVRAGVFLSLSAGDDSSLLSGRQHRFPASVGADIGGAVTVGSVDTHDGRLSRFSNYSSDYVEIAAPGTEKSSGAPRNNGILSTDINGRYSRRRGTAMAAAMVSSAAAILIGYFKTNEISYTPEGIERIILTSGSRSIADLRSKVRGGKVLDLGGITTGINSISDCK